MSTSISLTSPGQFVKISGWTIDNALFTSANAESTSLVIPEGQGGVYIVTFAIKINRIDSSLRMAVLVNNTQVLLAKTTLSAPYQSSESLSLSTALYLKEKDTMTFEVMGDNAGMSVTEASRSLLRIQRLNFMNVTEGMSGYKTIDSQYTTSGANSLIDFDFSSSKGTFLAKNLTALSKVGVVVLASGVFRLTAAVIIQNNIAQNR